MSQYISRVLRSSCLAKTNETLKIKTRNSAAVRRQIYENHIRVYDAWLCNSLSTIITIKILNIITKKFNNYVYSGSD